MDVTVRSVLLTKNITEGWAVSKEKQKKKKKDSNLLAIERKKSRQADKKIHRQLQIEKYVTGRNR